MHTQKILLVEDQQMFIDGLIAMLKDDYQITVAKSPTEMRACLEKEKFDLALMDIYLANGINGLDLLPELHAAKLKVLIVSGTATLADKRAFVELGARGFVSKDSGVVDLLPAIRGVLSDYSNFRAFPDGLLENLYQPGDKRPPLTAREITILNQLLPDSTKSTKAIADTLHITAGTIKKALTELFLKFGVKDRHHLVAEARRLGYYPPGKVESPPTQSTH